MNSKTKRIGLALALVMVIAVVAGVLWKKEPPLQVITLPNGEKYQFAGVTYGTTPVPPRIAARLVSWLPLSLANRARSHFGSSLSQLSAGHTSATPLLFVWFRKLGTNAPPALVATSLTVMLADEAGVVAGDQCYVTFLGSVSWSFASFRVAPRRSRVLQCYFYTMGAGGASLSPICKITIPNRLYGRFPQWQPEPIATVKKAGDLEVRLDALTTGPSRTRIDVSVRSSNETNETWVVRRAVLSDATGNQLIGAAFVPNGNPGNGYRTSLHEWARYYQSVFGTLWPDETAWRVQLELKRAAGFAPKDVVTFTNVPVLNANAMNTLRFTNTFDGVQIVLREYMLETNYWFVGPGIGPTNMPKLEVELAGGNEGVALNFVKAISSTGEHLGSGVQLTMSAGGVARPGEVPFEVVYLRSLPTNGAPVDITWAVQKTRTVEFLVKPPKPE